MNDEVQITPLHELLLEWMLEQITDLDKDL